MLENVTIIIPAHNRPERLERLLGYYRGVGVRIIVSDSSAEIYRGAYDREQVVYRHYPGMHFLRKIREILPLIETEYVLYCADDDFAVPQGIEAVTRFLDDNPDYSIAQGHYLTFEPGTDGVKFYPRYIRRHDNRVVGRSISERLKGEQCMYASPLYGVTRSEIFKKIYTYCFDKEGGLRFANLFLAEEFFNHAVMIHGNYATIPVFYSAREHIPGSATESTVPLSVVKNAAEYRGEYERFIEALAEMIADTGEMTLDEGRRLVRDVSMTPVDNRTITFKRRVMAWMRRHRVTRPLLAVAEWRYKQKGLRAVAGMASYPVNGDTAETRAIVGAIEG